MDRRTIEGSRDANFLSPLILGPASLVEVFSGDRLPDPFPHALGRLDGFPRGDDGVGDSP